MPHPADELLFRLRHRGVRLTVEGGALRLHPSADFTLFERGQIAEHRDELLAAVTAEATRAGVAGIISAGLDGNESAGTKGEGTVSDQQPRPGAGILFQNDRKTADPQPDYQGRACCPRCRIDYRLAGWKKVGKSGKPFLSLKLTDPDERRDGAQQGTSDRF